MDWQEYIITNEEILLGKPVIKGTRLSVDHILGLMAKGWSEKELLENYPRLSKEALMAVFAYVQDCLKAGLLYPPDKLTA